MTVEVQNKKTSALPGNSVTFTYSFAPIVIYDPDNLVVIKTTVADNTEETLTRGTGANNYSVSITTYPATGSIVYPADQVTPMTSAYTLTIKRVLTLEQVLDLENQGTYFPDAIEDALDKLIMVDLQQQEVIDRSVTLPLTTSGVSAELPVPIAGDGLVWNDDASALTNGAISGTLPDPVTVARGGTAATTAAVARTNLGLAIGTNVQAYDAQLDTLATVTATTATNLTTASVGDVLYHNGTDWVILAAGTDGYHLRASGAAAPVWEAVDPANLVQRVNVQDGAFATGSTIIPNDNTIPQNTEGDQYMSLAVTPTSSSNLLYIDVVIHLSANTTNVTHIVGLFQDSTAGALAAAFHTTATSSGAISIMMRHKMTAGTTSATTFKVRAGPQTAATETFNGAGGAQLLGGVLASSITITEVAV